MPVSIRPERPGDLAAIADIVARTYTDVPYSDHREHLMVERLRSTFAFDPALSLVAEIAGEAVGHILLTAALIRGGGSAVATLALAPLSVAPPHRSRGVGARLVRAAHRQAARGGFGSIVLVGLPDYYPRFGYEPLARYPIALPFEVPERNRMILPLSAGALDGVAGTVEYADGWLDH